MEVTDADIAAATRDFRSIGSKSIGLLVTGEDDARQEWAFDIWPEVIDCRKKTTRCRLWLMDDDDPREVLGRVAQAARTRNVTVQLLCLHETIESERESHDLGSGASVSVAPIRETFPVLHLATSGKRWGKASPS